MAPDTPAREPEMQDTPPCQCPFCPMCLTVHGASYFLVSNLDTKKKATLHGGRAAGAHWIFSCCFKASWSVPEKLMPARSARSFSQDGMDNVFLTALLS